MYFLRFLSLLEQRFQKFVAMAPVVSSPSSEMLKVLDHTRLRSQLSPISTGRVSQLEAPTKKGLNEYDKAMSSLEASVKKAMKTCVDHVSKVKQENEKEKARLQQLTKIRQKQASSLQKALEKASHEGEEQANKIHNSVRTMMIKMMMILEHGLWFLMLMN